LFSGNWNIQRGGAGRSWKKSFPWGRYGYFLELLNMEVEIDAQFLSEDVEIKTGFLIKDIEIKT